MMATSDCEIHVHENALATMICSTLLAKCEWKLKAVFGGGGGGGSGGGKSVVAGGQPCALLGRREGVCISKQAHGPECLLQSCKA
jgi:hypothetical protein